MTAAESRAALMDEYGLAAADQDWRLADALAKLDDTAFSVTFNEANGEQVVAFADGWEAPMVTHAIQDRRTFR